MGAQTSPERVDLLRSDWYARASADPRDTGDRAGAILLALRGLPADPAEADFATCAAARDALWRAVGSRALRLPIRQVSAPCFSPDGFGVRVLRAVDLAGGTVAAELEDEAPFLHRIHDMQGRFRETGFGSPTLERIDFAPPQGRALCDPVWSLVPPPLRTQIDAERVARPGG